MRFSHSTKKIMALMIVPLSFLVIGYALMFLIAEPMLRPVYSIYSLITSEYGPGFDEEAKTLYTGKTENKELLAISDVEIPAVGDQYGEIAINRVGLKTKLFYGDSEDILYNGAGQYQGSFMPGFNRTILIAGHTIPYFQKLGVVKAGDIVQISTHYGIYQYKVTSAKVGKFNDDSLYDLGQDKKEQLILYTCYPLDGIGFKQDRLFVYADKISGPSIKGG